MIDRLLRYLPITVLACCLFLVARLAAVPVHDPDTWWHLRLGAEMIDRRSMTAPPWTPLATRPWTPSEPLPEIVAAAVERIGGLPLLAWFYGATLCALVGIWFGVFSRHARPLAASLAVVVVVVASTQSLSFRPQLVSFALLAVTLQAWRSTQIDRRPRWWLVPLSWLWCLCHGFWFMGVGVGLLAWACLVVTRRVRGLEALRLGLVPLASLLVVFLDPADPFGTGVLTAPFAVDDTKRYVSEWQRTHLLGVGALTCIAVAVVLVVVWSVRRTVSLFDVLLVPIALVLVWDADRLIAVGAVIVCTLFADALESVLPDAPPAGAPPADAQQQDGSLRLSRRSLGTLALVYLVLLAAVVPFTSRHPGDVPDGLDAKLDALPAGTTVFNFYDIGGWMAWRHRDLNWVIDGLVVPYRTSYVAAYFSALALDPGWEHTVAATGATVTVLGEQFALTAALERDGWTADGTSDGYVLLVAPAS